ncbi:hypothetical protein GE061_018734 [Apolygus lucorum]|uniref:Retrotransposon gag domain-containing protein n=1 Tax=Apolygus lucorum TaxID=248454 RepID=A0A8S9X7V3_APOLU|nr:hypothetical protein GE061_018734 [Apolygus lucorum]
MDENPNNFPKGISERTRRIMNLALISAEESDEEIDSEDSYIPDEDDLLISSEEYSTDDDEDKNPISNTIPASGDDGSSNFDVESSISPQNHLIDNENPHEELDLQPPSVVGGTPNSALQSGCFYGKKKCFTWSESPVCSGNGRETNRNIIRIRCSSLEGPARQLGNAPKPKEVWDLLFSPDMKTEIVEHTNKKLSAMRIKIRNTDSTMYKDVDDEELDALFAIILTQKKQKRRRNNLEKKKMLNYSEEQMLKAVNERLYFSEEIREIVSLSRRQAAKILTTEPAYQTKEMLAFELYRREATPTGDLAKDAISLRFAMLMSTPMQATMVDVTTESKACEELLTSLETKFATWVYDKWVAHLLNRYNNLLEMDGADAIAIEPKVVAVISLLDKLKEKFLGLSQQKVPGEDNSQISDSDMPETDADVSKKKTRVGTLINNFGGGKRSPSSRLGNTNKPEPKVWKWRVRFDGSRDYNAEQFIERVEKLAVAEDVPFEKLLQQMVKLLEGKALTWLRSEGNQFESWVDFKRAFRETFLPPGYEDQLFDLIRTRKQADDETFEM